MIERVTVVKFRVSCGVGNGAGCFEVKVRADTAKFTNVIVADDRPTADASATFSTCSVYLYLSNDASSNNLRQGIANVSLLILYVGLCYVMPRTGTM